MGDGSVTLLLGGDVMTGRGVDQVMNRPSEPTLLEPYVRDARTYVRLAEEVTGPIPRPVAVDWIWGDALGLLDDLAPDVRLVNLETSVTRSAGFAAGKAVHYRMNPDNVGCLTVLRPICVLANNHVLDFGPDGLVETCQVLESAGITTAGAGPDGLTARTPARAGSVVVFSFGTESSGVPPNWAADVGRPGVDFLPDLSERTVGQVAARVEQARQPGDKVVVSIHWGSNWGYDVPDSQREFAHRLVDAGVDLVHGHSSHHPRPLEVYRGRLVLYGCGDLIDDYEGITGHEEYRPQLRLLYLATLRDGELVRLAMWPMRVRQMRLRHADREDVDWLVRTLNRTYRPFGQSVVVSPDGPLILA